MSNVLIHGEFSTYYTQRNNLHEPFTSCLITSVINAAKAVGYVFPKGEFDQPEDNLMMHILTSVSCKRLFMTKKEEDRKVSPIYTWNDIVALGFNEWTGKPQAAIFNEYAKVQGIVNTIMAGNTCVVTGRYNVMSGKIIQHSSACIGIECDREIDKTVLSSNVRKFLMRDPYGNPLTNYADQNGKLVALSFQFFMEHMLSVNVDSKWCITIRKRA